MSNFIDARPVLGGYGGLLGFLNCLLSDFMSQKTTA